MSNEIKSPSGRVVGRWDGKRIEDLQTEIARVKAALLAEGSAERLAPAGMPHGEQLPEDLRNFKAYPVWGCDLDHNCLCGANANRVVGVEDVRHYSMIDHH